MTISRCHSCQRQWTNNEALVRQAGNSTCGSQRNANNISPASGKQQVQTTILPRHSRFNDAATSGANKKNHLLLFASLMKEIPWIWDFIQKKPDVVIESHRKQKPSDICFADIQRVDGNPDSTNEDKLFRGVAQRSLALQFSEFENDFQEPRRCRRQGLIPTFVRDRLRAPNQGFAKQCIQAGQKQLKTEEAFRSALDKPDRPFAGTGISAWTALTITPFKNLRLGEIPPLIEQFFFGFGND